MIGHISAITLLHRHGPLFARARAGTLDGHLLVTEAGKVLDVARVLRGVEGELRKRGGGVVYETDPILLDLQSIVVRYYGQ